MKKAPKSAVNVVVLENSDPISAETEAIQSRIRQRAFESAHVCGRVAGAIECDGPKARNAHDRSAAERNYE